MGAKTKIDWCDATWNPITGCLHGCEYCYARKIAERFRARENGQFGEENEVYELNSPLLQRTSNGEPMKAAYPYGFSPTFFRYKLGELSKWKKPKNIFVCSMADMFGNWVPDEWIEEVFTTCENNPQHNYLFLTKNPGRYCDLERAGIMPHDNNFWFGATYDHSLWCKHSIDGRLKVNKWHDAGDWYFPYYPERNRFVSFEPLLYDIGHDIGSIGADWVIIGAETGNRKEKTVVQREWVEHIYNFCKSHEIPVFMKSSLAEIWGEPLIQEFPEGLKKGYGC